MNTQNFLLLIVDDEETMRQSMVELLRLEGYQTATAVNGTDAIRQLNERNESHPQAPFDLIVLDLKMPGVDGSEVLRHASAVSPDTQVILLTAHGSLQSAIEALQHGAHDYILKPASPEKLIKSVKEGLKKRAGHLQRNAAMYQLEESIQALRSFNNKKKNGGNITPGLHRTEGSEPPGSLVHSGEKIWITPDIYLNIPEREIQSSTVTVTLTPNETRLLITFVKEINRVFSHQELVQHVQGYEVEANDAPKIIRPVICRLRQKLLRLPHTENWITCIRSTGYVFKPYD